MNKHIALIYQNARLPFVFEAAEAAGIDLTLVHAPGAPIPDGLPAVVQTLALEIYPNQDAAIDVLRQHAERRPFDGVLTLPDHAVPFANRAAAALGLPGLPEEVTLAARDKSRMRERFRAAGLNCPAFVRLAGPQDIEQAARLRFPIVVKPISGFSSQGVIRADDRDQLRAALSAVDAINQESLAKLAYRAQDEFTGIIAEEFIDGPEYAIESFVQGGAVYVLSIGYKGNAQGPYFEEGFYLAPAPLPADVQAAVVDQVRRAIQALGITDGPTHTEMRLQNGVTPFVLEIGARVGGSGVSHFVVKESAGIDFLGLTLDYALGRADCAGLPADPQPQATAGNYIIPVNGHGVVAEIANLDALRRDPAVRRVLQFVFPGDEIQAYPRWSGYPGFILTRHASYAEGEDFYRMLDRTVAIRYQS